MSRGNRLVSAFCSLGLILIAWVWSPHAVEAHPICLVGRDTTLYRFNADGSGLMEEFPIFADPPGEVIGMTRVPPGVVVTGCVAGDVIAIEGGPDNQRRVWRIDGASCGTPELVEVGELSHAVSSIAFAHGRLFGIGTGAGFQEFDLLTFQRIGTPIDLSPTASTGGLTFDGMGTWYALGGNNGADRLFRCVDPPTEGALIEVGDPGIGMGDNGLEYFDGVLWGGFRGPEARLYVGTFDLQTGAFTTIWDRPQVGTDTLGIVMLPERSATHGDINCDGNVDGLDIAPFLLALTNPSAFDVALPGCSRLNADLTTDCLVNEVDVQPFVDELLGS